MKQAPELARKSRPRVARDLQRPVRVEDFGASASRFWVFVEEINQRLQCAGRYKSIWIKQQDIFSVTLLNGLIIRARETYIFTILNEMHLWEPLADYAGTLISGGIINHPYLKWRSWRICQGRGKTIFQKPSCVPTHYNDGKHRGFKCDFAHSLLP